MGLAETVGVCCGETACVAEPEAPGDSTDRIAAALLSSG